MASLMRRALPVALVVAVAALAGGAQANNGGGGTATPIQHLVVIFQENVSFDHYFATYPDAENPHGEPAFRADRGTPSVNGLNTPFLDPANENSAQPFRLDR